MVRLRNLSTSLNIWGDALEELERVQPDLRIINLETSVTTSNDYWEGKGIHYRMHPENIPCLTAAEIDYCSLANNHILDWGYAGLTETLATLKQVDISSGGAGHNLQQAEAPAVMEVALYVFGVVGIGDPGSVQQWQRMPFRLRTTRWQQKRLDWATIDTS